MTTSPASSETAVGSLHTVAEHMHRVGEAYRERDEDLLRAELRELAGEAYLASVRFDPLLPTNLTRRQRIAAEAGTLERLR